jgi:hypothetical protein
MKVLGAGRQYTIGLAAGFIPEYVFIVFLYKITGQIEEHPVPEEAYHW